MITTQKRDQRPKTLSFVVSGILCLAFIVAWTSPSFAADLTLSLPSEPEQGFPGQTVDLDLTLSYPGSPTASAFQLDIGFDTDVLTSPSATEGTKLIAAGKTIDATQPSSGVFRMIVSGGDQIIEAGEAAIISFEIKSDASPGETDLILSNMSASEPGGDPLDDVLGNDGSIEVEAAAIPTLSEWGMIIFSTVILATAVMILRKRWSIEKS